MSKFPLSASLTRFKAAPVLLSVACFASTVSAQLVTTPQGNTGIGPYPYARVAIEHNRFDDASGSANILTGNVRGGYMFLPNFGIEARAGTTIDKQEWTGTTFAGEEEIDYTAAALMRAQVNLDPGIAPYIAAGIGTEKKTRTITTGTTGVTETTETGLVGYLGLDLQLRSGITVGAEVGHTPHEATSFGTHFGIDF